MFQQHTTHLAKRAEELFKHVLDISPQMLLVLDTFLIPNMSVLVWSIRAPERHNYRPLSLAGSCAIDLCWFKFCNSCSNPNSLLWISNHKTHDVIFFTSAVLAQWRGVPPYKESSAWSWPGSALRISSTQLAVKHKIKEDYLQYINWSTSFDIS